MSFRRARFRTARPRRAKTHKIERINWSGTFRSLYGSTFTQWVIEPPLPFTDYPPSSGDAGYQPLREMTIVGMEVDYVSEVYIPSANGSNMCGFGFRPQQSTAPGTVPGTSGADSMPALNDNEDWLYRKMIGVPYNGSGDSIYQEDSPATERDRGTKGKRKLQVNQGLAFRGENQSGVFNQVEWDLTVNVGIFVILPR